ncbi:type II secretion system minor pseudopilin GspJ [Alkalispirillum mobile]|nr:type II secretion system minor pseudopilin GspJ [Alkalispirillum mobile]
MSTCPMTCNPPKGFTLLELLVAMAIFSLLAVMAYGGLMSVLDSRAHTDQAAERLDEKQLAFAMLDRDLRQLVDRPRRDAYGDRRPSLMLDDLRSPPRLQLVSAGARSHGARSELRRVGYEVDDGVLYRLLWPAIDGGEEEPQTRVAILGNKSGNEIQTLEFYFYYPGVDGSTTRSRAWPAPELDTPEAGLPVAVEIQLETAHAGEISRVFAVSDTGNQER